MSITKTSFMAIFATLSMLAAKASGFPLSTTTSNTSPRALDTLEHAAIQARDTCIPIDADINFCTISITDSRKANKKQLVFVADHTCKNIGNAYSSSTFDMSIPGLANHVTGDVTVPITANLNEHPSFCYGQACRGNTDDCWRVEMTSMDFVTHSCIFAC